MAKTEAFTCDGCGKHKGEVNFWWLASLTDSFLIHPWSNALQVAEYGHYCGQQCLTKALSEWMSKQAEGAR